MFIYREGRRVEMERQESKDIQCVRKRYRQETWQEDEAVEESERERERRRKRCMYMYIESGRWEENVG